MTPIRCFPFAWLCFLPLLDLRFSFADVFPHYCLEHILKSSVCAIYCQDRDSPQGWKIQAGKRFDDVHPIGCIGWEKVRSCPSLEEGRSESLSLLGGREK